MTTSRLTVLQLLPELEVGGVEQGTLEIAEALVTAGHRALVVSGGGRMVPKLQALGAEHFTLPVGAKRLKTLGIIRPLRRLLATERVDLVHARSRLPAWIGHFALRGLPVAHRPRWVTTVHGPYTANRYGRIMVSGDRIIAISEFIRDYLLDAWPGVEPDRVRVIPRGVDPLRFPYGFLPDADWRQPWALGSGPAPYLLTLPGRLTRWKGQEDFLRMLASLVSRGLPVHGLIVGGPHPRKREFEQELRELAGKLGLAAHVSFLGQRQDMREILSVSSLVYSLTQAPEAFGRTTLEALSLGRPVVGYDHGGTGEILRTMFPAGLVKAGDVEGAAERSAALLSATQTVPREHPFTLQRLQRDTLAVYEELCR